MKLKEEELPLLSSISAVSVVVGSAVVVVSAVVSVDTVLLRISTGVPHTSREASAESVNDKNVSVIFFYLVRI